MSIQAKILDAYNLYLLCDRNYTKTLSLTKITKPTLKRYVMIQEYLDFTLFEHLDKKGKEKLSIGDAIKFCENVINTEQQTEVFSEFMSYPKKERFKELKDLTVCHICADSSPLFEYTPCCNTPICESCLTKTFETYIQDIVFKSVDCPFCKTSFDLRYVKWYLKERRNAILNKELWRNSQSCYKNNLYDKIYLKNLYNKYLTLISRIEDNQDYYITDEKPNFKELLGEEKYFGACSQCTPKFVPNDYRIISTRQWNRVLVCDIPKQCGNGEGNIAVLQPEMFRCVVCKSRDEIMDNVVFKKCPHCGIRTMKPDGCNYIYCGDHRWCFICNERIENNEDGHNKHYWTGRGTGPYSNQCRQSTNHEGPKFTIPGKCDCSACAPFGGKRLCKFMDCMNRVHKFGDTYCSPECKERDN